MRVSGKLVAFANAAEDTIAVGMWVDVGSFGNDWDVQVRCSIALAEVCFPRAHIQ